MRNRIHLFGLALFFWIFGTSVKAESLRMGNDQACLLVTDATIQRQCKEILSAAQLVNANLGWFCFNHATPQEFVDCMKAGVNHTYSRFTLDACFDLRDPDAKRSCMIRVADKRISEEAISVCSQIPTTTLRIECLGVSADKIFSPNAVQLCQGMVMDEDKIACLRATAGLSAADEKFMQCSQEKGRLAVLACLQRPAEKPSQQGVYVIGVALVASGIGIVVLLALILRVRAQRRRALSEVG